MSEKRKPSSQFGGLGLKVILLALVPSIAIGGVGLWQTLSLTDVMRATANETRERERRILEADEAVVRVEEEIARLTEAVGDYREAHLNALLLRNASTDANVELRDAIFDEIDNLDESITAFEDAFSRSALFTEHGGDETRTTEAKTRLSIVYRASRQAQQLFSLAAAANSRTSALATAGDYGSAVNNYVFEERALFNAFAGRLDRVRASLTNVLENNAKARQREAAFNKTAMENRLVNTETWSLASLAIAAAALILLAMSFAVYGLTRPIRRLVGAMCALSDGKTNVKIDANRRDEIGDIARAVSALQDLERRKAETAADDAERRRRDAEAEKRAATQALAEDLNATVRSVVEEVSSAARGLEHTSTGLAHLAKETSMRSETVSQAASSARDSVESVAAAAEQMSYSIAEVAQQVDHLNKTAQTSVGEAERVNGAVYDLSSATERIGEVVKLISDIAEQTNLLALNATIEAARAGEAGKGFAVVASEVKALATQTAQATNEIGGQISAVQSETAEVVSAISGIRETISSMSSDLGAVAAAVEQQRMSTKEISSNVAGAAQNAAEVSDNIAEVHASASKTGVSTAQVQASAQDLTRQSDVLSETVSDFVTKVRAG